jgi:hypothetical protein
MTERRVASARPTPIIKEALLTLFLEIVARVAGK